MTEELLGGKGREGSGGGMEWIEKDPADDENFGIYHSATKMIPFVSVVNSD